MLVVPLTAEVSRRRLILDVVQLACCTTSLVIYDNRHLLPGYSGYIVYLNDDNVARNRGLGARAKPHYSHVCAGTFMFAYISTNVALAPPTVCKAPQAHCAIPLVLYNEYK